MNRKTILGAAAAALLAVAPLAASAHEDHGLTLGSFLGAQSNMGLKLGQIIGVRADEHAGATAAVERDNDNDGEQGERGAFERHASSTQIVASTTAARITARANRILRTADAMGLFSTALGQRIASSSLDASTTAQATALLSEFDTNIGGAKTQASAALGVAAQLGSTTGASSTADLAAQARGDLSAAREFIRAAVQDVRHILSLIFKA
jgi:hypothetical protein